MPVQHNNQRPSIPTYKKYDFLKSLAQEALPRDKNQSQRLHEPEFRMALIDPMSGEDIKKIDNQPKIVDGNLTIFFTSEANRKTYQDLPLNHPYVRLPYPTSSEDDRGG